MTGTERFLSSQIAMQNAVEFREVPAIALGITKPPENEGYDVLFRYEPERNIYKTGVTVISVCGSSSGSPGDDGSSAGGGPAPGAG